MVNTPSKIEGTQTRCKTCGREYIYRRGNGSSYIKCNSCWQIEHRDKIREKIALVSGKKCTICGYDKCSYALTFHHVDPSTKKFNISGSETRAWVAVEAEIKKCILLCLNCHAEVHAGFYPQYLVSSK